MKPLVIYHGNCIDGFTAAWCFYYHKHPNSYEFFPAAYQQDPPDVTGREVYIADFSYKRPVLLNMARSAKKIVVLDHHKTAEADLRDVDKEASNVEVHFDMNRSGAGMAWDYLFEGMPRPWVLDRVEDRDLWRFQYEESRAVHAYLSSLDFDFLEWTVAMQAKNVAPMLKIGETLLKVQNLRVREAIELSMRIMRIDGYMVPTVNAPYYLASDIGSALSKDAPFVATYYDTPTHRRFSLRSSAENPNAVDVSQVAEKFGGGGHKHSAGFNVSREHELAMV